MEQYKKWLEEQIEKCLNDKDLQREHWAYCTAYRKLIEALPIHGVSGKRPDFSQIHATAESYSDSIWPEKEDIVYKNNVLDGFEAGAYWAFSQAASDNAKGEKPQD